MICRAASMFRRFTSQIAAPRTPSCVRKSRISFWPWDPTPITPRVSLLEGGVPGAFPSTCAGTIQGAAPVARMDLRNDLRVALIVFILHIDSYALQANLPRRIFDLREVVAEGR